MQTKIRIKRYYYAEHNGDVLDVRKGLNLGSMPLVWNNRGLLGIISKAKVQNMIELMEDQKKLPVLQRINKNGLFYWDEVEIMSPSMTILIED